MRILLCLFLFTSCAVNVKTPATRFMSPEVQGHFTGQWNAGFHGATNVKLDTTNDSTTNPLVLEKDHSFSPINLELGFWNFVDVIYNSAGKSPAEFGLKFKLIGKPRKEAKKGNHALSVYIAGGKKEEDEYDDDIIFANNSALANLETTVGTIMFLYGYRVTDDTLIGLSIMNDHYEMDGNFYAGNNVNLIGKTFNYKGDVSTLGLFSILYFKSGFFTRFEIAGQKHDWDKTEKKSFGYGAISLGYAL